MIQFLKNNTIIICATIIVLWAVAAVTILIVTGNYNSLRSVMAVVTPAFSSVATMVALNFRVREVKEPVQAIHEMIANGDGTDTSP